jgi:hypothetical protein
MTRDSNSGPQGENPERSGGVECEAPQSGGSEASASPKLQTRENMLLSLDREQLLNESRSPTEGVKERARELLAAEYEADDVLLGYAHHIRHGSGGFFAPAIRAITAALSPPIQDERPTASGRVPAAPGSREPSPSVSAASGFDPSRAVEILEDALQEVAERYSPEGMGTANALAAVAVDALEELAELRARDRDRSGEADETRSGSAEGESPARRDRPTSSVSDKPEGEALWEALKKNDRNPHGPTLHILKSQFLAVVASLPTDKTGGDHVR